MTNYGLKDFEAFNDRLFPGGRDHLIIYEWNDELCGDYSCHGQEWWGTGMRSIYDSKTEKYTVIGASLTD